MFGATGYDAWDEACARPGENRAAMIDEIGAGRIDGLLARRGEETVGWLHFGPAARFQSPRGPLFVPHAEDEGAIVCFIIAAAHRRTGVARTLLRVACETMAADGFRSVSALAVRHEATDAMHQFTGPLALYLSASFAPVEVPAPDAPRVRVRRGLP